MSSFCTGWLCPRPRMWCRACSATYRRASPSQSHPAHRGRPARRLCRQGEAPRTAVEECLIALRLDHTLRPPKTAVWLSPLAHRGLLCRSGMVGGLGSQHSPPPRSPKSRPFGAPSDAWSLPSDVPMSRSPPPSPMTGRLTGVHHHLKGKDKTKKSAKVTHKLPVYGAGLRAPWLCTAFRVESDSADPPTLPPHSGVISRHKSRRFTSQRSKMRRE